MYDTATLILSIIGAVLVWTTSVIGGMIWLNAKFAAIHSLVYREMDKHRREDDRQFDEQGRAIQRLELNAFGFTESSRGR